MDWIKHGLIYCPTGTEPWARSHAMVPTPFHLNDEVIRIFHSTCDQLGRASIAHVDVDARDPRIILGQSDGPILTPGRPGTFDENGVLATSVVRINASTLYLYYVGFELGTQIRYRLLTGLAISHDGGTTFKRSQETPILERCPGELYFRGGPFVLEQERSFRMWYVAGDQWIEMGGKQMPVYVLKHLTSLDGLHWGGPGVTCLELSDPDEHGFGRPWVIPGANGYDLYYSIRRKSVQAYRLGYASSSDGLRWDRRDAELGLDVTPGSFDGSAIMYSAVLQAHGKTWCFYNGDNFGVAGIALAERVLA